ncbi:uncharacterized protein [Nicotiana sylvestris]|uniref:peptidylprolyl isomerase n=1 Tax=Nicotiana sylvestris TaxID=4096 RepID=A0A1U7YN43_NICSY|nr:PREDICTED: uncharacterized protein LOC104249736 [Nicotiana sylvestris]
MELSAVCSRSFGGDGHAGLPSDRIGVRAKVIYAAAPAMGHNQVVPLMHHVHFLLPSKLFGRECVPLWTGCGLGRLPERARAGCCYAVSLGIGDAEVSTSEFEDFSVTTSGVNGSNKLKISVNVSGAKTEEIFGKVFSRMVEDAQPIPGFRRVKGGKTPNIPRDILIEILGYSKVYKQVIKKIINSTISEYVEKDGLAVFKDLQIEQSFEDLEAIFEPGEPFTFSAIVQRRDPK